MGKPHLIELQTRGFVFVEKGYGHPETARQFYVSPKCLKERIELRRENGSLAPWPQCNGGGHSKLTGVTGSVEARVTAKAEITLDVLIAYLADTQGIDVHRCTVWRVLLSLGLMHKTDLQTLEQKRKESATLCQI